MTTLRLLTIGGLAALALAACSSPPPVPISDASGGSFGADDGGGAGSNTGVSTLPNTGRGQFSEFVIPPGVSEDLLENLVVYFEFDSSEIRSDFNAMLAAHGRLMASNPGAQVRLEGHADERGSREYNVGLGERRALAVRQILLLQGASASQLSTVSYGEERPAVFGSDEESYSLNRRVEIIYQ